jgi:hypothetical protein
VSATGTVPAGAALAALALAASASATADHRPLACLAAHRYARVSVHAPGAAGAELQFRTSAATGWYAARMTAQGEEWAALLPRPARAEGEVEYRIVVTSPGAADAAIGPFRVPVSTSGACAAAGQPSVDAPLVVRVPHGAPVVPPVPAGLSPAGVVAAAPPRRSKMLLTVAGAAAAAGVAAAALGGAAEATSGPPPTQPVVVPEIRFDAIDPPPGSTLSASRDRIAVSMRLGARPSSALIFQWRVELFAADGRTCLFMESDTGAEGVDLVLTAPLRSFGCGPGRFDTERMRISIRVNQDFVFDETLALSYHFEP